MDVSVLISTLWLSIFGSAFGWLILRRIDRLEKRIDGVENRVDGVHGRINGLPTREEFNALGERISRVEYELAAFRSDLTQIALAVGARIRPQTG